MSTLEELCAPYQNQDSLSVETVRDIMRAFISPTTRIETVSLHQAFGRVVATDICSPINVPPHHNSAMDGYAFHSTVLQEAETLELTVVGERLAGSQESHSVELHQCIRIMTGAVMPDSCDTVIPQEMCEVFHDAAAGSTKIRFQNQRISAGTNRRLAGEDLAIGQHIVTKGKRLHAADLGLLASVGIAEVPVYQTLRVAYFSTGDELRSLGETLDAGCIYDSNRFTLCALLREMQIDVIDLGVVRDEPETLRGLIQQACRDADVILTSGGMSMGTADYTKQIMHELGEVQFWNVEMRPGRPMAFGRLRSNVTKRSCYLFGLPGNPVAAMLNFLFITRPALQQLQGLLSTETLLVPAKLSHGIRKRPGRTEFQRCIVHLDATGQLYASTTGSQGSGILRSMSEANAILVLGDNTGDLSAGEIVHLHLLHGLFSNF
ncbi:molybdopterin molybdotransferase MoeA [Undibacterium cyanobacteriorum]|uniref:Molybdopterin molybdenumtransferase n=1 Tax=Undibacterium cyanobacteriorum TaxID=3073561 RepID=A0ABY9REC4_9BURK|nr:gephyrin-like molybdotransferase Glp [Undibacterium sp. 20NA77.5]WMW79204.1 molybdopterin molybdotransferase MoeA [Undibacterium sp. 20NA77.5]